MEEERRSQNRDIHTQRQAAILQMPEQDEAEAEAEEDDQVDVGEEEEGEALLQQWPTVDGPLGVQQEQALKQARAFFYAGFFLLPWLWFVNCFYFWPVLRHRPYSDPHLRPYVLWSGVGFMVYSALLLGWALTFSFGGEKVFGSAWKQFVVYDIADKFELSGS